MPFSEDFLRELKSRNDIISVVSGYVDLKRRGRTQVGLCPFHNEDTPSFTVYPDTESFFCFGCQAGGDVVRFIQRRESLDYRDAVKFLAERVGMDIPKDDTYDNSTEQLRRRIYEANREAARFFYSKLNSREGKAGLDYLRSRCLSDSTIKKFGLGFAPDEWSSLTDYLINEKGFKPFELEAANLSQKSQKGNLIDRFRNRVMFPIIDVRGNVIAFGGRIMTDEKPKYLNTSDTPAFKKGNNIFALNMAKNSKSDRLILCEGYMDVIAIHQAGFDYAIAGLGTAFTLEQARIIKRYAKNVILCYDADEAGQKATLKAIDILRGEGLSVKVLVVPDGKDPDEFIKKHGENGSVRFKMLIDSADTDVDYRLKRLRKEFDTSSTDGQSKYVTACARVLAGLNNPVERDLYAGRLCDEFDVTKTDFKRLVDMIIEQKNRNNKGREFDKAKSQLVSKPSEIKNRNNTGVTRVQKAEEFLISYLFNNQDMVRTVYEKLKPDKITEGLNRRLYETITRRVLEGRPANYSDVADEFTLEENSRIVAMLSGYSPELYTPEVCRDYVKVILDEYEVVSPAVLSEQSNEEVQAYIDNMRKQKMKKKPNP